MRPARSPEAGNRAALAEPAAPTPRGATLKPSSSCSPGSPSPAATSPPTPASGTAPAPPSAPMSTYLSRMVASRRSARAWSHLRALEVVDVAGATLAVYGERQAGPPCSSVRHSSVQGAPGPGVPPSVSPGLPVRSPENPSRRPAGPHAPSSPFQLCSTRSSRRGEARRNHRGLLATLASEKLEPVSLICADCEKPLVAGVLVRTTGPVNFHACACGGLWISDAQLERLMAHAAKRGPRRGATPRRCPSCREGLAPIQLPRSIACEACRSCKGVWLDTPDFPQLAVKGLAEAALAASTPNSATLRCAGCQSRLTEKTRLSTPKGDFCSRCAPARSGAATVRRAQEGSTPASPAPMNPVAAGLLSALIDLAFDELSDD